MTAFLLTLACDEPVEHAGDHGLANDADTGLGPIAVGATLQLGTQTANGADFTLAGPESGARLGSAVWLLDDGDGDGLPDVLAAGLSESSRDRLDGAVWLSQGPSYGRASIGASDRFELSGGAGSLAGWSACSGDLDGDGSQELAVGAPQQSSYAPWGGAAYVVEASTLGSAGLASTATIKLMGLSHHDRAGQAVGCGDLDGDGLDDLVVGAPGRAKAGVDGAGVAYLLSGPLDGFSQLSDGAQIGGRWDYDGTGGSLLVHDLDGDGLDDVVLGNPREGEGGTVYVVAGQASPSSVRLWSADHKLKDSLAGSEAGTSLAAGDIDNDGYLDLVIGAPGRKDQGEVFGVYGPLPGSLNLWNADFRWKGLAEGDRFGQSIALADLDGDGGEDLVVGAPLSGSGDEGSAFFFLGAATGTSSAWNADARVKGSQPYDYLGRSVGARPAEGVSSGLVALGAPGGAKGDKGLVVLYELP